MFVPAQRLSCAGFFPDGFGEFGVPSNFFDDLLHSRLSSPEIDVKMSSSTVDTRQHASIAEGIFPSPFASALPPECQRACFQVVTPTVWQHHHHDASLNAEEETVREEMSRLRPIVIVLAGTGEQGYDRRRHLISYPLARLGIASLVFESPFYGKRRPAGQVRVTLLLVRFRAFPSQCASNAANMRWYKRICK